MKKINREEILQKNQARGRLVNYRLAVAEDIRPGAMLAMAEIEMDEMSRCFYPIDIFMENQPEGDTEHGRYVYYHCFQPDDPQDCFVPKKYFLDVEVEMDMSGPFLTTLYLVKKEG